MKQRMMDRGHGLHVIAAAVLVALGSSYAAAQQPGQSQADRPQTQSQSQRQDPLSQRQDPLSSEQSAQDPASQRAGEEESDILSADTEESAGSGQLDQIAQEHEDLSTFVEAVKAAGMEESLTSGTEYTVFAPTNDAFEQMSGLSTEELMRPENREQLISLLRAHIVADDVDENLAQTLQQAQTIDGGTVELSASGDEIQIGDATVVESGIQMGSLRVYGIDQVLEPTAVARAEPGSGSESETESQPETESDIGSPLETEPDSGLDPQSERESDSPLERDDPFGSEPGAQPSPGAERPGAGAGSELDPLGGRN